MEDVIVVTINYRLHALGFLCLPNMGIPGNAGMKDQQMALEWVHENIANFNGDPSNICLFGESAGAACTHLHVMNPKSSKFIKSAICQSGNALHDWFFQRNGEDNTRRLAKLLGAQGSSDEECLNVLMKASLPQIFDNNIKARDPKAKDSRRKLPFVFKPVIEKESDDAFITMSPADFLKNNKCKIDIPIIFGLNNGDGMTMVSYFRNNRLHLFDNDYIRLIPMAVNIDEDSDEAAKLAVKIKQFYFGDNRIDKKMLEQFVMWWTDNIFTIPQTITNELCSRYQPGSKLYIYEFCYDGELNAFKRLLKMTDLKGSCHFDELFYLFDAKLIGQEAAQESPAWKMRQTMCKMWTNFAKYGDPTPEHDKSLPFKWDHLQAVDKNSGSIDTGYLKIDKESKMMKNMYKERVDFWRELYDKYNSGLMNPKF